MSRQLDDNSYSPANAIAVAGLTLALSYENAAVDRLEKRLSKSIVPEVKEKIKRHLDQTKQQQERLRERIKALGMGMEPISEKGKITHT
jgi:ferritin-like metal-binding protein YciE